MADKKCPRCKQSFPKSYFTKFKKNICIACQFKELDDKEEKENGWRR